MVPAGEVWRLLWAIVENNDSALRVFRASILTTAPIMVARVDEVAIAGSDREVLLLSGPLSVVGYNRRGSDLWLPPNYGIRIRQLVAQAAAASQFATLAFVRYSNVRGQAVTEGVAAQV